MSRLGVKIVSPETLPLAEQIAIFEQAPAVIGMLGSAFHTALLSRRTNLRMVDLTRTDQSAQAPYAVIDALLMTDSTYVGCLKVDKKSKKGGFDQDVVFDVDAAIEGVSSSI